MKEKDLNNEEAVVIESDESLDDSVIAEEHQVETIKKLREKLKVAQEERAKYLDGWQREKADFINLRKRDEDAKTEFLKFAKSEVVADILPVLDSFDLALGKSEDAPKEWVTGMESIRNQLLSILGKHGITKIDPLGQKFDPSHHEAIATLPVREEADDGIVVEVLQAGYDLSGKNLRPAKVKVGEYQK